MVPMILLSSLWRQMLFSNASTNCSAITTLNALILGCDCQRNNSLYPFHFFLGSACHIVMSHIHITFKNVIASQTIIQQWPYNVDSDTSTGEFFQALKQQTISHHQKVVCVMTDALDLHWKRRNIQSCSCGYELCCLYDLWQHS